MNPLHREPPPPAREPLVISPACLAPPMEVQLGDPPPMPPAIERPAGEPNASNFTLWLQWLDRRRERAELAGLDFEGQRNAYKNANELNGGQLRQCNAWALGRDGH